MSTPAPPSLGGTRRGRARVPTGTTVLLVFAHVVLLCLGLLLAMYGALLLPRGPRVAGHVLSVGVVVAVVGNVAVAVLGRAAAGRFGGATPLLGWLVVAYACSVGRPNGSVVLPGAGDLAVPALVFLFGGAIAGALGAALKPPRRWRTRVSP